jgi:hypothetical protein
MNKFLLPAAALTLLTQAAWAEAPHPADLQVYESSRTRAEVRAEGIAALRSGELGLGESAETRKTAAGSTRNRDEVAAEARAATRLSATGSGDSGGDFAAARAGSGARSGAGPVFAR